MSILTTAPPEEMRDFLHPAYSALEAMFAPTTVALIGATERHGSIGRTLLENLSAHPFGGAVYPVNPRHRSLLGQRTFARVGEIPATVDLAVIAIPARAVPGVVAECRQAGVRGAVILSAGFAETGEAGKALETQIVTEAHLGGMRIIGPNCLGIMLPHTGLNATFATGMAQTGMAQTGLEEAADQPIGAGFDALAWREALTDGLRAMLPEVLPDVEPGAPPALAVPPPPPEGVP
jgi:acetyltransferase